MRCSVSSKDTHVFCRYDFLMSVRSAFKSISKFITCSSSSASPGTVSGRGDGDESYLGIWRVSRISRRCEIDFQMSKARSKLLATVREMFCAIFRFEQRKTWQVSGPSALAEGNCSSRDSSSPVLQLSSSSSSSVVGCAAAGALLMNANTLLWVASAEQ